MISLPLCQCKICIDCLKSYFEVQVKEKHVRDMVCPVCEKPDIQDETQADTHFTYISVLVCLNIFFVRFITSASMLEVYCYSLKSYCKQLNLCSVDGEYLVIPRNKLKLLIMNSSIDFQ